MALDFLSFLLKHVTETCNAIGVRVGSAIVDIDSLCEVDIDGQEDQNHQRALKCYQSLQAFYHQT
jgi:hypothetical protein